MLYRLSISEQRGQFLLKGTLLFDIWFDVPHRPTHDADLLGFGSTEIPHLENLFREVNQIASDDGIVFQTDSVKAAEIRKEANHAGGRVTMQGLLDGARCPAPIDIGFGDAVTSAPENVRYSTILNDMPQPQLRVYLRYTVVAEKLEAMVKLGVLNSRMKDYFDLWALSRHSDFDGAVLATAIRTTFERRGTDIPPGLPFDPTGEFARHEQKNMQWAGFQRKNALEPMPLAAVIEALRDFLSPVLTALAAGDDFDRQWRAGAVWDAARRQASAPVRFRVWDRTADSSLPTAASKYAGASGSLPDAPVADNHANGGNARVAGKFPLPGKYTTTHRRSTVLGWAFSFVDSAQHAGFRAVLRVPAVPSTGGMTRPDRRRHSARGTRAAASGAGHPHGRCDVLSRQRLPQARRRSRSTGWKPSMSRWPKRSHADAPRRHLAGRARTSASRNWLLCLHESSQKDRKPHKSMGCLISNELQSPRA